MLSQGPTERLFQDEIAEELFNDAVEKMEEHSKNTENPRPEEKMMRNSSIAQQKR